MFKHRVAILGLLLSSAAQAAPVTFDLTGTVTQAAGDPGVAAGEQIPIVITIDDAYPATTPGGGIYSYNAGFNPVTGFGNLVNSAIFAGLDRSGLFQTATVDPGGGITFHTTSPQVGAGFDLALSGALGGVLPTTALPTSLSASQFTSGTFSVTEAFSPTQFGFSGVIDGLASAATAVPEPASWAMLAGGLAALAWFRSRAGRAC